jgi:uncharacterized protein (DUF302 family)
MFEDLGFTIHIPQPYEQALEIVAAALKTEGFGVLTRIDVRATLKEKLNVDFRPYAILGACNPPLAHRALSTDASVGLMLPCNVTVEAALDGGTLIKIANPEAMMMVGELADNEAIRQVAAEARGKLERVAKTLAGQ